MGKQYSVHVEDGEVTSVEVEGVIYSGPDQISDPMDREEIEQLIDQSSGDDFEAEFEKDWENFNKKFEEREKNTKNTPPMIGFLFIAVAIILLTIAVISAVATSKSIARERSAPGQVTDMVIRRSPGGKDSRGTPIAPQDYYYPVVQFALPDGTSKTVQLSEGSWPPAYEKGEQVTILYDPQKPIHARIQSSTSNIMMWILPGITGLLGFIFLIVSIAIFWFSRPAKAKESAIEDTSV